LTTTFSPDEWLVSLFGSLTDYINAEIDQSVMVGLDPQGLRAYEVVMDFPDADSLPEGAEFNRTIIHFGIDDIETRQLGFGPGIVNSEITDGTDLVAGTVSDQEAKSHVANFDVGIWASDESGGITSRLRAYQLLDKLFNGMIAKTRCWDFTEGVEIRFYNGGRFVNETINDVRVFRAVGMELEVRVYSRQVADDEILVDREPDQDPDLEITNDSGSLVPLND
jgi:hypothetical protein